MWAYRLTKKQPTAAGDAAARNAAIHPPALAVSAPGRALDPGTRTAFELRYGHDFSRVRVHTDAAAADSASALAARAYAFGEHIVFNAGEYAPQRPFGQHLLAHELAHVVQQRRGGAAPPPVGGDRNLEAGAQCAADAAMRGGPVAVAGSAGIGIARQPVITPAPAAGMSVPTMPLPVNPFTDPMAASSPAQAAKALVAYQKLVARERRLIVSVTDKQVLKRILAALLASDQVKTFVDPLREIGRFVQESATYQTVRLSDDQIADEEAKFLIKQAADAAQTEAADAAKRTGAHVQAPTPADVERQRQAQVAKTSIGQSTTSWWTSLGAGSAAQQAWKARGAKAIADVVAYAAVKHPELAITAANFNLDFAATEARGATVIAAGSPALVGREFVEMAALDPAYVMDIVVHEVYGHPEYGQYGTEYSLALYDRATKKIPGYQAPDPNTEAGRQARLSEVDAYAYQETEIYAVLRSMNYRTAPTAAHKAAVPDLDTQGTVTYRVSLVKQQWAPALAIAILRGLRQRLVIDPRVPAGGLAVFDKAVLTTFDAATLTAVAK